MPLDSVLLLLKTKTKSKLKSNRCCAVSCQAEMGRAKRKWTRERIAEALLQNARVNATPAEPEDAAVKRKRQQRRSNKKRNLIELNSLSVTETNSAAPPAVPVIQVRSILPAQTTLELEAKQEEDDPTDHQAAAKQARNAEQQRARRAKLTASQTERIKEREIVRRKASRARMTYSQRNRVRETTRVQQQQHRVQQTPVESVEERERNRRQHQARCVERTPEEVEAARKTDRLHYAVTRVALSESMVESDRAQNRVRRKAPKRCLGHVDHEDFRASMVTGKDVVDGWHRLPPTTVCPLCQAWKWPAKSDFISCLKGRVQLPPLQPAPPRLLQLYGDKEFRRHIRAYNQKFAFTSIRASSSDNTFRDVNQDQSVTGQRDVYTYRIQGAMGHFMGSMLPYIDRRTGERVPPKLAQIYIVDPDMQERANRRKGMFANLDIVALQDIENMMVECNPFAQQFLFLSFCQKLREYLARGIQVRDIRYVLHSKPSDPRTYNLPTVSEVGVAMIEDGNLTRPRDLYVVAKDHSLLRLFETDEKYDPLQYPLLFPYGDLGWTYTDNQKKLRAELYHGISNALLDEETITLDEGEVLVSEYDRATGTLVHPDRVGGAENPYLCQKYDCHINVEVCTTIGAIKYLYKYVYKGSDRAVLTIEAVRDPSEPRSEPNEILRFLDARYISLVEAAMRILTYEIQGKTHAVTTLTVHLEGSQMVMFQPNDDPDRVLGRAGSTMLTSFFKLCASPEPENDGQAVAGFDLPQLCDYPTLVLDSLLENNLIRRELEGYDHSVLQDVDNHTDELNEGQRAIYDLVLGAVHNPQPGGNLFFIDGPGGTGKSTIVKHILASVRLSGKIAIAVAPSGIAALLLMGGRTAHSTFKVPLKLDEKSVCSIHKQSKLKKLFQEASLIIWDEAPMTHRHAFESVDRSLRDVLNNDEDPFGGKTVVLSGDFRQILSVVVRGTRAETIDACLKSSHLRSHFRQVHLTENMLVRAAHSAETAADLVDFSDFLLQVEEGRHDVNRQLGRDYMKLPRSMLIGDPPEAEVDEDEAIATDEYFANRTILTTTNVMVHHINDAVAARHDGDAHEYRSIDKLQDDEDWNFFEPEILNSVNINGIPPHKLTLNKGAPMMLMRNLNPDLGLCNGTRLRVVELKPNVIHAKIMTGERRGQDVLIPRIVFIRDGNDASFPYQLRRKQFPVQSAFAMTINKAQGQTVHNLGLYLASPCFSHGQLCVTLSRDTAPSKTKAVVEYPELEESDGVYTANIVYRQIFDTS
ncbi:unnamed protein product [Phytophthora fragariaefolia]|uniref:ATP-dependent DNA helicase n=1 Tax=Phytophthora fragariaefolia TaxID=1490495 RepID=A0A9W6TZY0_9STRA|nr:unnamed protein product [Phytophthora fragariaefolia]